MVTLKFISVVLAGVVLLSLAIVLRTDPLAPPSQLDPLAVQLEKSRLMARTAGHPDWFFQYHHDIRSSADGMNEYPTGYRIKEFNKALANAKTFGSKLNWVERGPGNVGGRTRALLVDPDDPQRTWWAGSVSGGLWKTIDRGRTWQPQTDNLPNLAVSCLAMAESDPNVIYMGTGEGFSSLSTVAGDGIFKSVDRGVTWSHLAATANNADFRFVNRLAVDPTNPDMVLTVTNKGVFRSANGGVTWTATYRSSSQREPVQDLRAQPGNFNRQIASVGGRGILYSTDAGMTWAFASVDLASKFYRIELAYSPSSPDIAYAAVQAWTRNGSFRFLSDLHRSDDGGMSWTRTFARNKWNWFGAFGWYNNTLAVHPFKPDTVFVGGITLWTNRMLGINTLLRVSDFDYGGADEWLQFSAVRERILHYSYEGRVYSQLLDAVDVSLAEHTDIEIRFGQGGQMAHRFSVPDNSGTWANGSINVPRRLHMYGGYVEVPFQVWDSKNNRQLMISFRDQADDGEFNLIPYNYRWNFRRDETSMEYIYVHKYDYDSAAPDASIAQDGGYASGALYLLFPVLASAAVSWDPDNLPNQTISISFEIAGEIGRVQRSHEEIDVSRVLHVDHHAIVPIPIDEAQERFWILNANDGGVALSTDNGRIFRELDEAGSGYNTMQVYGVAKKPGAPVYIAGAQDNGTWRSPV